MPARARLGYGLRLEGAFGLRQVNQILRHALFLQHAPNHFAVASRAAQPGFHDGAAARRLEIIQVSQHRIVDRQRKVVVDGAHFAFGAAAQIGIEFFRLGDGLLGDFIDGRGRGFLFAETVARAEGFEFVQAHGVDNMVIQIAQARVRIQIEAAGQQLVERLVKLLARLAQMAGLEILLAGVKCRLALRRQLLRVRPAAGTRSGVRLCAAHSAAAEPARSACDGQGNLRGANLHRVLGGVFTPGQAEHYTGSNEQPSCRFLGAISHGVFLDQFETTSGTALRIEESTMPAKLRGRFPPPGTLLPQL